MKEYELKCYEGDEPRILVTENFVYDNNLKYTHSVEEIKDMIKNADSFDFGFDILIDYLPWELAKEFYKEEFVKEVSEGKQEIPKQINDIYETAQDFLDYMVFGWMKAMDERGLSASRTISKLGHWLWLMGRDDLKLMVKDDKLYNPYGTPALIAVCNIMGIKVPDNLIEFSKNKC